MIALALLPILAAAVQLGSHLPPPIMPSWPAPDEAELMPLTATQIAHGFSSKALRYRHGPQNPAGQGLFCPDGRYFRQLHGLSQFGNYTIVEGGISIQLESSIGRPVRRLLISKDEMGALFANWDGQGWAEIEFEDHMGPPCADTAPR